MPPAPPPPIPFVPAGVTAGSVQPPKKTPANKNQCRWAMTAPPPSSGLCRDDFVTPPGTRSLARVDAASEGEGRRAVAPAGHVDADRVQHRDPEVGDRLLGW